MSVDLFRASAPAALASLTGIAFAYLFYKKFIEKWYGESKKINNIAKIKYWLGVISCFAIFDGTTKIANEFLFVAFNESAINGENLYKGAHTLLGLPLVLGLIGFLIGNLFGKPGQESSSSKNENHYNDLSKNEFRIQPPVNYTEKEKHQKIDFKLHAEEFKAIYQVNQYDLAKAKNEMDGLLLDKKINSELMRELMETSSHKREAEKKYIYIRALEISKSDDRNHAHQAKMTVADSLDILKRNGVLQHNDVEIKNYEEPASKSSKGITLWGIFFTAIIVLTAINLVDKITRRHTSSPPPVVSFKLPEVKEEKTNPNFFNSDMTYTIKNCSPEVNSEANYQFIKFKTSIDDRTAVLFTENENKFFNSCLLDGRNFQCTRKELDKPIERIVFDVIYMNFDYEVVDKESGNLQQKISCQIQPTVKLN